MTTQLRITAAFLGSLIGCHGPRSAIAPEPAPCTVPDDMPSTEVLQAWGRLLIVIPPERRQQLLVMPEFDDTPFDEPDSVPADPDELESIPDETELDDGAGPPVFDIISTTTGVQERLAWLGYEVTPSGLGDEATRLALRRFQQDAGLPVSGCLDDTTRTALVQRTFF